MRPSLYVSRLLPDEVMRVIHSRYRLCGGEPGERPPREALLQGVLEAEALLCTLAERIDQELFARAPRLKIVANYAVGYNNIDLEAARARGVVVTNTPDVLTDATADLTWALLLAAARRIPEGDALVRSGRWGGWEPTQLLGAEVAGKTLGVIGLGRIGTAVARRAAGFQMPILYCSRRPAPSAEGAWRRVPLDALLAQSDFVTLHVPLTAETHHLIGAPQLALMKPTAFLINTARGPVVDEGALVEALRSGRLAGAGLDVYEQEPVVHPALPSLPQVTLLPHLGSATRQARVRMGLVCLENIDAVLAGRPAPNRIA